MEPNLNHSLTMLDQTQMSDTQSVFIHHPATHVFRFLANPENLPKWAVGFCHSIRKDPADSERWIVSTGQGEVRMRMMTEPELGTIDFVMEPRPGATAYAFSRVIPTADSGSEYVFTQVRPDRMPAEVFQGQVRALTEELQVLRAIFSARAACAA